MELIIMNQKQQRDVETLADVIETNPNCFQQILAAAHLLVIKKQKRLEEEKQTQNRVYNLDLTKYGFRWPSPPPDQFIEPIHVRAQEARKWGKRIKLRKETTLAMKELQLPLAVIINIIDFI